MNRSVRKLLSVACLLAMLLSLCLPAYAEGEIPAGETEQAESVTAEELTGELTGGEPTAEVPETGETAEEPTNVIHSNVDAQTLDADALDAYSDVEFYVADFGSDEGDGSYGAPFASLARAAAAANSADGTVYIILLSDLASGDSARFYTGEVHILSEGAEAYTVTRVSGFHAEAYEGSGEYNPSLIECGFADGSYSPAVTVYIENVILDDAGLTEGTVFAPPAAGEENLSRVQSGIVAAYGLNAAVYLDPGTALHNYGGLTAAYACDGARILLAAGASIRDTMPLTRQEGQTVATDGLWKEDAAFIEDHEAPAETTEEEPEEPAGETDGDPENPLTEAGEESEELPTEASEETEEPAEEVSAEPVEESTGEPENPAEETSENPAEEAPENPAEEASEELAEEASDEQETSEEPTEETVGEPEEPAAEDPDFVPDPEPAIPEEELTGMLSASTMTAPMSLQAAPVSASGASLIELAFTAPESVTFEWYDASKDVPYTLGLTLSDNAKSMIQAASGMVTDSDGTITVTLDSRLTPETDSDDKLVYTISSQVFTVTDTSVSGNVVTIRFKLSNAWSAHLGDTGNALTLNFNTTLNRADMVEDEYLVSSADTTLDIVTSQRTLPLQSGTMTANTKMLGPATALLIYNGNGGYFDGNSAWSTREVQVSPQTGYVLDQENVPTRENVNDKPVVFFGWTTTQDSTIYSFGETAPETVEKVDIPQSSNVLILNIVNVYAVYGYDENEDGIADVVQTLLTLSYDANGGEGAPDPETKASQTGMGAKFDISEVEPTRQYYTFKGWSKDRSATEADYKYDAEKSADRDLVIHEDTTLYAVWEQNPVYTLYYNANGGAGAPASQSGISEDGVVHLTISSVVPTRSGYNFLGWGTSRSSAASYFAGDDVQIRNGNVMLYAIWERNGSGYSGGSGGSGGGGSNAKTPKTGDTNNIYLWIALLAASLLAAVVIAVVLVRKNKRKSSRNKAASKRDQRWDE